MLICPASKILVYKKSKCLHKYVFWSVVLNISSVAFHCVHTALKKGRFWITPDPYHNDDNIQIGREVKISCQVEATPPEELMFSWLKNGRPLRSSERMVITQTDPDVSPGTTNLDIIDLKFTDFGTYTCVASLKNGGIPEISIDVNISSTTGEHLVVCCLVCLHCLTS